MKTTPSKLKAQSSKLIRSSNDQAPSGALERGRFGALSLAILLSFELWSLSLAPGRADIAEPDNLLYGTIVIGTNPVTAARTDVVVEARRTESGPVVASYRMGTNPGLGSFYLLRIPVEAFAPLSNTNASVAGVTLYIVLRDAAGVRGQASYAIPERGAVQRVNFGVPVSDSDGNGLPDDWEIAHFGGTGQTSNADADGDGQSNRNEWIAGTNPRDGTDAFHLSVGQAAGEVEVAFLALRAEGPGYEGVTRLYSLLSSTNVASGLWSGVPNFTNLPGNNQTVGYRAQIPGTNKPLFFRGAVRLE